MPSPTSPPRTTSPCPPRSVPSSSPSATSPTITRNPTPSSAPLSDFTSSISGSHYLSPKDVATIYDLNAAYNAGYSGSGQTIVVAGESAVAAADIAAFQAAAGVATNTPNLILVPNTGSSAISTGNEAESDLDLEYTSTIAPKATIDFIYTGNNLNYSIFDAFNYAIQNQIGTIITISYGECEPDLSQTLYNQYEGYLKQAAAQGQTVINSSGDDGSTGCYQDTGNSTAYRAQVAVSYPSSSAYVTGLGGTEFPSADTVASNNTYFTAANGTDVIGSALSYIPEQAWNDDSTSGLSSGGGGISIYTPRPSWQTGVIGIPSGSFRLTPDISLDSSPNNAGYLYCSSDTGTDGVGFSGSCTNGFRVSSAYTNANGLTIAGGTSFAAPIFAGMLAILNQARGFNSGQGLINPTLYSLAANSATYATAFHDITSGGNQCLTNSICTGAATTSYATTTGYDLATGLGSVDLYKLIQAWPKSSSTLLSSTTTATPRHPQPGRQRDRRHRHYGQRRRRHPHRHGHHHGQRHSGDRLALHPRQRHVSVQLLVRDLWHPHDHRRLQRRRQLRVIPGNPHHQRRRSRLHHHGFSNVAVASGGTVTENLVFTSTNGYVGTVVLNTVNGPTVNNACFTIPATSLSLTANQTVTLPFTIYTNPSNCPSGAYQLSQKGKLSASLHTPAGPMPVSPWRSAPMPVALAGLLLAGCFKRRSRLFRASLALAVTLALGLSGLGLTGCSNKSPGATTTTSTNAPTGVYSFSLSASDSVNASISATSNTFTITIQ